MTRKECFALLELEEGALLQDVKRAYRRLAFALHPDLNPDVPGAARRFQRLNEAYVLLTKTSEVSGAAAREKESAEASARARADAQKAYSKAGAAQKEKPRSAGGEAGARKSKTQEDVLKDILTDPCARRVFEDIYSHIKKDGAQGAAGAPGAPGNEQPKAAAMNRGTKKRPAHRPENDEGLVPKLKGWFRKQIDDEQILRLPGALLVPGAKVRLEIRHGLTGEPQAVELTLPPEFMPGKAMRLKGMGKRLGSWRGDLYVRIEPE